MTPTITLREVIIKKKNESMDFVQTFLDHLPPLKFRHQNRIISPYSLATVGGSPLSGCSNLQQKLQEFGALRAVGEE